MGIRAKIMSGFLILATMLLVAGAWSIYELKNIGISAQIILDENYKSIDAAKVMIEALEREDSAVLLLLLGKRDEGMDILKVADGNFQKALEIARNNITIPGERNYVDAIEKSYASYRKLWQPFTGVGYRGNLNLYFQEVNPTFITVKTAVTELMSLNHRAMYQTASYVEGRAHRATMPGIIAIAAAFIFANGLLGLRYRGYPGLPGPRESSGHPCGERRRDRGARLIRKATDQEIEILRSIP